jgi:insertion element IS1 protein InsB
LSHRGIIYPCGIPLRIWIWTVVNHQKKGILFWNLGERSPETFEPIWQIIKCWHSFWYVTDGWKVDPMYIQPEDHLVNKTYMTRAVRKLEVTSSCAPSACLSQVEGENTRLRHYLARLHRKTLCYSKSLLLLKYSLRLLLHYLRFGTVHISV